MNATTGLIVSRASDSDGGVESTGFPMGCADAAGVDGRRGSNVYEVNPWLWQFGRGKPRLGGLSVEDTQERKAAASAERCLRAVETRRRRKADPA